MARELESAGLIFKETMNTKQRTKEAEPPDTMGGVRTPNPGGETTDARIELLAEMRAASFPWTESI